MNVHTGSCCPRCTGFPPIHSYQRRGSCFTIVRQLQALFSPWWDRSRVDWIEDIKQGPIKLPTVLLVLETVVPLIDGVCLRPPIIGDAIVLRRRYLRQPTHMAALT